jgi:small subunit ribosomal protein S30e
MGKVHGSLARAGTSTSIPSLAISAILTLSSRQGQVSDPQSTINPIFPTTFILARILRILTTIVLQVEPQEKSKVPKGRALKRLKYTRRFVNVALTGGKRKVSRHERNCDAIRTTF